MLFNFRLLWVCKIKLAFNWVKKLLNLKRLYFTDYIRYRGPLYLITDLTGLTARQLIDLQAENQRLNGGCRLKPPYSTGCIDIEIETQASV